MLHSACRTQLPIDWTFGSYPRISSSLGAGDDSAALEEQRRWQIVLAEPLILTCRGEHTEVEGARERYLLLALFSPTASEDPANLEMGKPFMWARICLPPSSTQGKQPATPST